MFHKSRWLSGLALAVAHAQNAVNGLGDRPTEAQLRLASAKIESALTLGLGQVGVRPAAVHELALKLKSCGEGGEPVAGGRGEPRRSSATEWGLNVMRFDFESAGWGRSGDDGASIVDRLHFHAYLDALDSLLAEARAGQLSPMWRYEYEVRRPNPVAAVPDADVDRLALSTSTHDGQSDLRAVKVAEVECLTCSDAIDFIPDVFSLSFCARLDVAAAPRRDWEPGAADGDWRRALLSWYQAALRVHERRVEGLRHPSREEGHDQQCAQLAVNRDLLEASYRAGLAAGTGTDNGWRDWLVDRTSRWRDQDRAATVRLMLLDFETPAGTKLVETNWEYYRDLYRGVHTVSPLKSLPFQLPAYWTQPSRRAGR